MKSIVKASQRTVVEDAIAEATNGISSPDGIISSRIMQGLSNSHQSFPRCILMLI